MVRVPQTAAAPPPLRRQFLEQFPWKLELDAWQPAFIERLPTGMRLPQLYRIDDLGDDRIAVWMEQIDTAATPWDLDRFARAARVLGRFAARSMDTQLLAATGQPTGHALRMYAASPVQVGLRRIKEDAWWQHPAVRACTDLRLRDDLARLGEHLAEILDALDKLPQSLPHGDASPQNLLVPASDPDTFVAIDIAFQAPQAIGFDLSQLLIGLVHAGELPAAALPDIHPALVDQYMVGLTDEGVTATQEDVVAGFVGSLVVRSGFTALPWHTPPSAATELAERARLTRYIVDLGLRHLDTLRP